MKEDRDSAARYRQRAQELRAIADAVTDTGNKKTLLDIAEDYERMARSRERIDGPTGTRRARMCLVSDFVASIIPWLFCSGTQLPLLRNARYIGWIGPWLSTQSTAVSRRSFAGKWRRRLQLKKSSLIGCRSPAGGSGWRAKAMMLKSNLPMAIDLTGKRRPVFRNLQVSDSEFG